MARIAKSDEGIARAAFLSAIAILVAQGGTFKDVQALYLMDRWAGAIPTLTRDAFGGMRMGFLLDLMVKAQNGKCLLCSRKFWSLYGADTVKQAGTNPVCHLLIPSVLTRDVFRMGTASNQTGWAPGNVIAACTMCNTDRDRASIALGEPVVTLAGTLTPGQESRILLSFPSGLKESELDDTNPSVIQGRALRVSQIGY
jgi:hypothetical protein